MEMNCGKLKKYAFRVTKNRNMASARVRVPGGSLNAKVLGQVQHIAETYGNGEIHLTIRQGFEIMGIPFEKVEEVKETAKKEAQPKEVKATVEKKAQEVKKSCRRSEKNSRRNS